LKKDSSEMEEIAKEKVSKTSTSKKQNAKKRADVATEARITRIKAKG